MYLNWVSMIIHAEATAYLAIDSFNATKQYPDGKCVINKKFEPYFWHLMDTINGTGIIFGNDCITYHTAMVDSSWKAHPVLNTSQPSAQSCWEKFREYQHMLSGLPVLEMTLDKSPHPTGVFVLSFNSCNAKQLGYTVGMIAGNPALRLGCTVAAVSQPSKITTTRRLKNGEICYSENANASGFQHVTQYNELTFKETKVDEAQMPLCWSLAGMDTVTLTSAGMWTPQTSKQLVVNQVIIPQAQSNESDLKVLRKMDVKLSLEALSSRIVKGGIDLQFDMTSYKSNKEISAEHVVGRFWTWSTTRIVPIAVGSWQYEMIRPIPSQTYAGLTRGISDQNVIRSLSALSSIFGSVKDSTISDMARTSINRLLGRSYSPIHIFVRLASLYVAAIISERDNKQLQVIGTLDHSRQFHVSSWNSFSQCVHNSDQRRINPLPFLPRACAAPEAMYRVLVAAILGSSVLSYDGAMPSILRMFPPVANLTLVEYSDTHQSYSGTGTLSAYDVAACISFYANTFGLHDMAEDAVRTAFTLSFNTAVPSGHTAFGATEMLDIGTCDTTAWSLIHIIQPEHFVSTEDLMGIFDEPDHELFTGLVRSMALCHSLYMNLAQAGGNVLAQGWLDQRLSHNLDILSKATTRIQPIMAATYETAKSIMGVACHGPLLNRYKLLGRNLASVMVTHFKNGRWPQAEELIPMSSNVLRDTSLVGHVTPAAPTKLLHTHMIHKVSTVTGALDRSSAFYSLIETTKKTIYHTIKYSAGNIIPQTRRMIILKSYRGIALDGQFCDTNGSNVRYHTAFELCNGRDAHTALNMPSIRATMQWWYDWYSTDTYNWSDAYDVLPPPMEAVGEDAALPESETASQVSLVETPPLAPESAPEVTHHMPITKDMTKTIQQVVRALGPAGAALQSAASRISHSASKHDATQAAVILGDTLTAMDYEDIIEQLYEGSVVDEGVEYILNQIDLASRTDTRTAIQERMSNVKIDLLAQLSQYQHQKFSEAAPISEQLPAKTLGEVEESIDRDKLQKQIQNTIDETTRLAQQETEHVDSSKSHEVLDFQSSSNTPVQSVEEQPKVQQQVVNFEEVEFAIPQPKI